MSENNIKEKAVIYYKLKNLVDTPGVINITRESWEHLNKLWNILDTLVSTTRNN